ncbi:MAG: DinB family protein [Coriobacteriia bacterium]|nr:DinB family protein [Coriobacteriia bacterium]
MQHLRELLARQLDWEAAHVGFGRTVADFPPELRGVTPAGFAHSGWEFLEHLRLAQADILAFCVDPGYVEPISMEEYWPAEAAPPDDAAWDASIAAFQADVRALQALALDEGTDLFAPVPTGSGQTYLRELLLTADHNAYHLGQLVALRRVLGCWPEG